MNQSQINFMVKQAFDAAMDLQDVNPTPGSTSLWSGPEDPRQVYVEVSAGQVPEVLRLKSGIHDVLTSAEESLAEARELGEAEAIPYLEGLVEQLRALLRVSPSP